MRKKYFGDRVFYKMVLLIAVPIMVQNGFTNFVNLIDNLMVGRVGTDQMSGVAIVNQLFFVFNLSIFGGLSGAGIFTSQYHGGENKAGVKNVFRVKLVLASVILLVGLAILFFLRVPLISLSLHEGGSTGNSAETLKYAEQYLLIMLLGLPPYALSQCYSSTLCETGETVAPMKAGILSVTINMVLNYLLIYGKLGFPELGVQGAATATVISRFAECAMVMFWTSRHCAEHPFAQRIFELWHIPPALVGSILKKGLPLLLNEFLWSAGMTILSQCFSMRGLAVVAGINISDTFNNVVSVVFVSLGTSVSIIVGRLLGAGKMKEARDTDTKMIVFAVLVSIVIALFTAAVSPFFPRIYNTTDEVRSLATSFMIIMAAFAPFFSFNHATYFTLRSGGKTWITFLFDSCFMWVFSVPVAFLLSRFTALPIIPIYAAVQGLRLIKCAIGFYFVRSGSWMQNVVNDISDKQ